MDTNTALILGLFGLGGYMLYTKTQRPAPTTPFNPNTWTQQVGTPPTQNTNSQEWLQWAGLAISLYGAIDDLWMEGGPFHDSGYTQAELLEYYDEQSPQTGGGYYDPFDPSGGYDTGYA